MDIDKYPVCHPFALQCQVRHGLMSDIEVGHSSPTHMHSGTPYVQRGTRYSKVHAIAAFGWNFLNGAYASHAGDGVPDILDSPKLGKRRIERR